MADHHFTSDLVDESCALLRDVLLETRGLDRRAFLAALGRAATGCALLAPFATVARRASAAEAPVTALVFGGVWKKSATPRFYIF